MPILFADDTNLFCTGTELKEMIRQVNEEMAKKYMVGLMLTHNL